MFHANAIMHNALPARHTSCLFVHRALLPSSPRSPASLLKSSQATFGAMWLWVVTKCNISIMCNDVNMFIIFILGPMVLNLDGSISRIANWDKYVTQAISCALCSCSCGVHVFLCGSVCCVCVCISCGCLCCVLCLCVCCVCCVWLWNLCVYVCMCGVTRARGAQSFP